MKWRIQKCAFERKQKSEKNGSNFWFQEFVHQFILFVNYSFVRRKRIFFSSIPLQTSPIIIFVIPSWCSAHKLPNCESEIQHCHDCLSWLLQTGSTKLLNHRWHYFIYTIAHAMLLQDAVWFIVTLKRRRVNSINLNLRYGKEKPKHCKTSPIFIFCHVAKWTTFTFSRTRLPRPHSKLPPHHATSQAGISGKATFARTSTQ